MKILLISIGTRGDIEPILAIGDIFRDRGHDVTCLLPEQYKHLAEDAGFAFESLGTEFIDLIESPEGRTAMAGGRFGLKKIKAYYKLLKNQGSVNQKLMQIQEEVTNRIEPDRIIHNGKAIYPVIWSLDHPETTTLNLPIPYIHYVKGHAQVAFHRNFGRILNKLSYKLADFGYVQNVLHSVKWLKEPKKYNAKDLKKAFFENQVVYTISPTLFERPSCWPNNLHVLGFHERDKAKSWTPDDNLEQFLNHHQDVIMVSFGSMINDNPIKKTKIILDILVRHHIPAIINTGSGGLVKPEGFRNDNILFVPSVPYDWLFPRLHSIIHHGGSGTTHMGMKHGLPTLIIPHIIDQYSWNQIVAEKGAGPKGIDISQITVDKLEPLILDLISNQEYVKSAKEISRQMSKELFAEELYQTIMRN